MCFSSASSCSKARLQGIVHTVEMLTGQQQLSEQALCDISEPWTSRTQGIICFRNSLQANGNNLSEPESFDILASFFFFLNDGHSSQLAINNHKQN